MAMVGKGNHTPTVVAFSAFMCRYLGFPQAVAHTLDLAIPIFHTSQPSLFSRQYVQQNPSPLSNPAEELYPPTFWE